MDKLISFFSNKDSLFINFLDRLLPLSGSANYHNYHHTHNIGNYSSFFTFWDTIFGTNKNYFKFIAKKEKDEVLNEMRRKFEEEKKMK